MISPLLIDEDDDIVVTCKTLLLSPVSEAGCPSFHRAGQQYLGEG